MPDDPNSEYYIERKLAALAMSQAASDPAVRNIHRDLASRYDDLATASNGKALKVAAIDGTVTISSEFGELATLTPAAAGVTSDRLLAGARDAGGQTLSSDKPHLTKQNKHLTPFSQN